MKKWYLYLLMPLLMFFGTVTFAETAQAKELTDVIGTTTILNSANATVTPSNLFVGGSYKTKTTFDLSKYDNQLANGDYFVFNMPAPLTVTDTTYEFSQDGVAIADITVTSNGENLGGTVKVTLKNLDAWLAKTGNTSVIGVTGNFDTDFTVKQEGTTTIQLEGYGGTNEVTITVKAAATTGPYTGEGLNYLKRGGVIQEKTWTSDILGRGGSHLHPWNIRINEGKTDYKQFVLTDTIESEGIQFIPELVKLYRVNFTGPASYSKLEELNVADYIKYNSSYTQFVLTLGDIGTNGYVLEYPTTALLDGSTISNTATATASGEVVKPIESRTATSSTSTALSQVAGITLKGRVDTFTIFKRDKDTHKGLNGVVFELTDTTTGQVFPQATTDTETNSGIKGYLRFNGLTVGHSYSVREVSTLPGYELDTTPYTFTIAADATEGAVYYWDNQKTPVDVEITAKRNLLVVLQ